MKINCPRGCLLGEDELYLHTYLGAAFTLLYFVSSVMNCRVAYF